MRASTKKTSYDPHWQTTYADMIATPEKAVAHIRSGQRVFLATGCAQPQVLVRALTARASELTDTEILNLFTEGDAPYAHRDLAQSFRVNSLYVAENVRGAIQEGLGDYTPILLSDVPRLFHSGQLPLDAALIQVSPPNSRGMCSLGISVDIVKSAAENASLVIAQVNPQMPVTQGDSLIHVRDLDVLVPVDEPLVEWTLPPADEETRQIGQFVAALVEDGATVEFGIGRLPQSIAAFLKDKKNLGIHTELITDAIVDLIQSGVVTGGHKSLDRGKVVASFGMGTKKLYDYLDDNPSFAFHPSEYVNDPDVISQQHRQVAINEGTEIDLTGQVCADSIGGLFHGGIGGQVDFNRGASRSSGGKAIIVMPSTANDGKVSRIVTRLSAGAGVVTTRGDVHYVVTEHGVAYLHGKSVQARVLALISVAHPKFRARLVREAIEAKYLNPEMAEVEGKIVVGSPQSRTTYLLKNGTQINFRPIHPTDEPNVRDLFYALSQETIYYRFMTHMKRLPSKEIQNFVFINHRSDIVIVGTVPEAYGDEIVAIGRYFLNPTTNMAEVAFIVRDDWQNRGIGSFMLKHLSNIARHNGIRGFTAEVLNANKAMQSVIHKCEYTVTSEPHEDVVSFTIEFS